jgi:hypothetical protein
MCNSLGRDVINFMGRSARSIVGQVVFVPVLAGYTALSFILISSYRHIYISESRFLDGSIILEKPARRPELAVRPGLHSGVSGLHKTSGS